MIDIIKNKFKSYGYEFNEEKHIITFSKKNLTFKLIKQRFKEIELYFSNSCYKNIKLDFTLEIFENNLSLDSLVKNQIGDRTENEILKYYYKLIFEKGLFLVRNKEEKVDNFINWYENESDKIYNDYLIKLKDKVNSKN